MIINNSFNIIHNSLNFFAFVRYKAAEFGTFSHFKELKGLGMLELQLVLNQ